MKKVNNIIEDRIKQMKYGESADDTSNELKHFQDFLYHHFYKHECYEELSPRSNQLGRYFCKGINLNLSVVSV